VVVAEARRYLEHLEAERDRQRAAPHATATAQGELPLYALAPGRNEELRAAVAALDPDVLTPRDALAALYRLKTLLEP
jgi:DNA mismatch repair protein MutS